MDSAGSTTIAAISTPPGVGGIAVVRLSGPAAFAIAARHLTGERRFSTFCVEGRLLDEVVVNRYHAPHSYTGEDTVEFACHGSAYVQQALLQALIDSGARLAEPGEFTRRAFLNGRLDLSQAEAVADLIDATDAGAHALAISQLRGGYAQRLRELRDQFVELTSLLELELDFSDEEVEFADRDRLLALLDTIDGECWRLCDSFRLGNAIKHGIPVAIVGKPNVGKSTLLNALVGEERAIVSDIPGTTRDTIEDSLVIGGIRYRFIDTAGLRHSDDTVESLGIERSYHAAQQAQVILYLVDAAEADTAAAQLRDLSAHVNLQDKKVLLLLTKCDMTVPASQDNPAFPGQPGFPDTVRLSARTGLGLDALRQHFSSLVTCPSSDSHQTTLSNVRHYEALRHVLDATALVRQGLTRGLPADLVVIDLRDALHHLGTITGQVTSDEVLGAIFSRFCIGK